MNFREEAEVTKPFKKAYAEGFEALISRREAEHRASREKMDLFGQKEESRKKFYKMLGWPLGVLEPVCPDPSVEFLGEDGDALIYRMHFQILPELTMTGLFFHHKGEGKRPFVIAQHGGWGSPELIVGCYFRGDTVNYNEMAPGIFEAGADFFAPQLLLWKSEDYGVPIDRENVDRRLKKVGSSVTAVEVFGIECIISYFEKQPYAGNIGMIGLSYGGFYTLFAAAADTRIRAAVSCGFFNEREAYAWADWTWDNNIGFQDAEIACLVHPRKLWIRIGNRDELFDSGRGEREYQRLVGLCGDAGTDWLDFEVFDGNHEFPKDRELIRAFYNELV